jgi:hypothetical protein
MKRIKSLLFYYDLVFTFFLLITGLLTNNIFKLPALLIVLIPLTIYFWGYLALNSKKFKTPSSSFFWIIVSLLLIFNLLGTLFLSVGNLFYSHTFTDVFISLLYLPFPLYFFQTIFDWYKKVQQNNLATLKLVKIQSPKNSTPLNVDLDRRRFLKILGGTGISVFLMSLLNPRQAGAAFFGSVPGPGTVALKNASGVKINPAEKQATDGYKISKIDDISSNTYAYYGFVNQGGAWYIQRETVSGVNTGDFQYYKGDTDFSTSWGSRDGFTYDDFEDIF